MDNYNYNYIIVFGQTSNNTFHQTHYICGRLVSVSHLSYWIQPLQSLQWLEIVQAKRQKNLSGFVFFKYQ